LPSRTMETNIVPVTDMAGADADANAPVPPTPAAVARPPSYFPNPNQDLALPGFDQVRSRFARMSSRC
jgi:hypothetical protein